MIKKVKLGEVLDVKRGASLSGEFYSKNGEKIRLTLGNFNYPSGGFKNNTSKTDIYFTGTVKPEFIMKKGDIITPLTEQVAGLLGETARIPEDDLYIQSGDIGLIVPNPELLDNSFAYYLLPSPVVKKQLGAGAQQTKIRHTSPEKIKDCEVWIPEMPYQKLAGALLDSINAKISTNNRINSELESMAKTIYDYWFTQFDFPDENGKPYKSSGGKMVWNEELKREIPEGWEVKPLSYHLNCNIHTMKNYDKYTYIEYLDTSNLTKNKVDYIQNVTSEEGYPSRARRIIMDNDILYSTVRPAQCHYGIIKHSTPCLIASTGFSVLSAKKGTEYNEIFYLFITNGSNSSILDSIANSSVSSYPSINSEDILNLKIALPNDITTIKKVALKLSTIFEMIANNQKQNKELASLRDWLLPMLMNGQVGFKEVE